MAQVAGGDISGMLRRNNVMRKNMTDAKEKALAVAGSVATRVMFDLANIEARDTARYMSGWGEAHNDLGVAIVALPPIVAHKGSTNPLFDQQEKLERQVERLLAIEKRMLAWKKIHEERMAKRVRSKRVWKSHKKMLRKLDRIANVTDKAIGELDKFLGQKVGVIVIGGRRSRSGRFGKSQLATVRLEPKGGTASITTVGSTSLLTLHNREPHASLVERNTRIGARGLAYARSELGLRRVSKKYLKQILKDAA